VIHHARQAIRPYQEAVWGGKRGRWGALRRPGPAKVLWRKLAGA